MKKILFAMTLLTASAHVRAQYYAYVQVRESITNSLLNGFPVTYTSPGLGYQTYNTGLDLSNPGWVTFAGPSPMTYGTLSVNTPPGSSIVSGPTSVFTNNGNNYIVVNTPNVTAFQINGNGISTNAASRTALYYCNNVKVLNFNNTSWVKEKIKSAVLKITVNGGTPSVINYGMQGAPQTLDMTPYLPGGFTSGTIDVELINTFTLNSSFTSTTDVSYKGYANYSSATAAVDYLMTGPGTCADQNRKEDLTFPSLTQPIPAGAYPAANCGKTGWLGASSAGVSGWSLISSSTGIIETKIVVDRVDPANGNVLTANIINYSEAGGVPVNGNFNYLYSIDPAHFGDEYFRDNYATIKNSYVFRTTVSVNSPGCGWQSKISYFKIIDGVTGKSYRPGNTLEEERKNFSAYPNPAKDQLNIQWYTETNGGTAAILISDVMGRVVKNIALEEQKGSNTGNIGLADVAPGTYFYKLKTTDQTVSGQFTHN